MVSVIKGTQCNQKQLTSVVKFMEFHGDADKIQKMFRSKQTSKKEFFGLLKPFN